MSTLKYPLAIMVSWHKSLGILPQCCILSHEGLPPGFVGLEKALLGPREGKSQPVQPVQATGRLRRARNEPTYPVSAAISTSLATALARCIWRGVRQRTLSSSGLATTTARQRARLVATFSRFRL